VVLTDNPLLALRLHQHGVSGIAIVEDPAVLVPLTAWLAERDVITITTAKHGHLPLPQGVVPVGTGRITGALDHAPAATLALLGFDPGTLRQSATPLPMDPRLPGQLHTYAQRMLASADGQAALAQLGVDRPDVVNAYRIGYLPSDFRQALTDDQRRRLLGMTLGGCVVLPAFDAQGAVVDLVAIQACAQGHVRPSLWDAPRGVCAPVLGTACEHLCLTTVARWVGRLYAEVGPTALIRDVAHVAHDAARFAAGGVRRVEIRCYRVADADAIAAAMTNVGITARIVSDAMLLRPGAAESLARHRAERETGEHGDVPGPLVFEATEPAVEAVATAVSVPPESPPHPAPLGSDLLTAGLLTAGPTAGPLTLLRHDAQTETAVFQHGDATYTVQLPLSGRTTVAVTLAVGTTQHRDRFDVAVAPQRLRFAAAAGRRVQRTPALIAADLESLLPLLLALNDPAPAPAATSTPSPSGMTEADHAAALTLLRSPDLLKNLLADLDALGWVGEDDAKRLCVLAAISRFSDEPVWAALTCEEAGERFPGLGIIAAITPPEHVVRLSRLTDSALCSTAGPMRWNTNC
jgi:hypothetical protein